MTIAETKATPSAAPPAGIPPQYGSPISLDAAERVVAAAEAFAKAKGWPVVIAVFDSTGHLSVLHRLDQANLGAVELAQRKAETAVRFRRPTKVFEDIVAGGGTRLLSVASDIITLEGGLPLLESGKVIGSIGVSGLTSAEDAQVAQAGAAASDGLSYLRALREGWSRRACSRRACSRPACSRRAYSHRAYSHRANVVRSVRCTERTLCRACGARSLLARRPCEARFVRSHRGARFGVVRERSAVRASASCRGWVSSRKSTSRS